jgi:hypothetical protein
MNMGAMEAQLNKNMKLAQTKERIRAKAEAKMKEKMARLRAMRGKKVKGGEIHQLPIANHVRLSPYQNF